MTNLDFYTNFLRGINMLDSDDRPSTAEVQQFLKSAVDKFSETRYTGMNSKQESFESTQKRIDDLRTLVQNVEYLDSDIEQVKEGQKQQGGNTWSMYQITIPENYWHFVKDDFYAQPICGTKQAKCWSVHDGKFVDTWMDTTDVTKDTVGKFLSNSLSPHIFQYGQATQLREMSDNYINIYTDGTYKPGSYYLTYLKNPTYIDVQTFETMRDEWKGLPEHTHREIVQIQVNLWLSQKGGNTLQPQAQMEAAME